MRVLHTPYIWCIFHYFGPFGGCLVDLIVVYVRLYLHFPDSVCLLTTWIFSFVKCPNILLIFLLGCLPFSCGFVGIGCLFYTSLVRNICVLAKTNKIGAGLKLVEGVIVEKEREKFQLLYFRIFQKAKLWFPCPDYMITITQRELQPRIS